MSPPPPPPPPMRTDAEMDAKVRAYWRVLKEAAFKPEHIPGHVDAYRKGLLMEREANYPPAPANTAAAAGAGANVLDADDVKMSQQPCADIFEEFAVKRAKKGAVVPEHAWEVNLRCTMNDFYHRKRTPTSTFPSARAKYSGYNDGMQF